MWQMFSNIYNPRIRRDNKILYWEKCVICHSHHLSPMPLVYATICAKIKMEV